LVLTIEIFGMDFRIKDLTFDFPHTLGEIKVDATPMHIKVQDMKITHWNLPMDVQVQDLNLGFEEEQKMVKFNVDLDNPCCNPCFGFVTKARVCKGVGRE
jgi:hypothetical protein